MRRERKKKGPKVVRTLTGTLEEISDPGVKAWLVILIVNVELVRGQRQAQLGPMVHWSTGGSILGVNEWIVVVFEASIKSNDGEAEMPEWKGLRRP